VIRLALSFALSAALLVAQPALTPMDEAGYQKLVAAQKGKVLLVNFWATWCEPCRAEMPALAKMEARLKAKGFAFVTVSADEPEDSKLAREFLKTAGITGTAYLKRVKNDDKFIAGLEAKWSGALPALFLYDRTGKRVKFLQGETDLKKLEAEITKLL
jgi:thiol-disulfide isomerase/thioredoxin